MSYCKTCLIIADSLYEWQKNLSRRIMLCRVMNPVVNPEPGGKHRTFSIMTTLAYKTVNNLSTKKSQNKAQEMIKPYN